MDHYHHIPAAPLSECVELLWYYIDYQQPHSRERCLPTGTVELVINLREEGSSVFDQRNNPTHFRDGVICGPHSQYFVIDTSQASEVIGIHFKPGGAFRFLRMPVHEVQDRHISLDTLWGSRAGRLRERLLEAPAPQDKFRVLEQALLERIRGFERHPAVAFALDEIMREPHARTIADLTHQVGLSPRRFIQVFREEVGLTPKLFCRVRRFQQVLQRVERGRRIEWADIALSCGYFDQAHFIHDFRAFSGLNPTAYLAQRSENMNHVPILD